MLAPVRLNAHRPKLSCFTWFIFMHSYNSFHSNPNRLTTYPDFHSNSNFRSRPIQSRPVYLSFIHSVTHFIHALIHSAPRYRSARSRPLSLLLLLLLSWRSPGGGEVGVQVAEVADAAGMEGRSRTQRAICFRFVGAHRIVIMTRPTRNCCSSTAGVLNMKFPIMRCPPTALNANMSQTAGQIQGFRYSRLPPPL